MMEERLVKGEYCLSTSGVGSPPHSLPSTSGTQNDKIEDVHCACISKLETQVEEQVNEMETSVFRIEEKHFESLSEKLEIPPLSTPSYFSLREFAERISFHTRAILQNKCSDNASRCVTRNVIKRFAVSNPGRDKSTIYER